ncbi:MAG: hypothetical protein PVJ55_08125 [Anaerolineae bacterium]|jgi:hypothetical protein
MFYPSDRVLVGIMNRQSDFAIARDEGWYRIPERTAPGSTTEAVVLAFYFTRAFDDEKWAIHYYAPIEGHELVYRRDLLPHQPDHPRADEPYYKLQLGPVMKRDEPIPSLRWRRVTFIESTWDRFVSAQEINDLYATGADGLYVTLKEDSLHPEREFLLREGGDEYVVDMAIPCLQGTVCVAMDERPAPENALRDPDAEAVREAVEALGGESPPSSAREAGRT